MKTAPTLNRRGQICLAALSLGSFPQAAARVLPVQAATDWSGLAVVLLLLTVLILVFLLYRAKYRHRQEITQLRQSLARDLHDEVGSRISVIQLNTELIRRAIPTAAGPLPYLRKIDQTTADLYHSIKDLGWSLHRANGASGESMVDHLEKIGEGLFSDQQIDFTLQQIGDSQNLRPLSLFEHRQLLLILREAMTNTYRHAGATKVSLTLCHATDGLRIDYRDDGRGFSAQGQPTGAGLDNMQTRARALGAECRLQSDDRGTTLWLRLPLRRKPADKIKQ